MCGIIGAIAQHNIVQILLEGLQRLEYRGYDSSGMAIMNSDGQLIRLRRLGKVQKLIQAVKEYSLYGNTGIAHTRWATHGKPSESNAHPHISEHIVVVHNGIIENHELLHKKLQTRGYFFISETDTEVIAHLVHWEYIHGGGTLRDVIIRVIAQLHGTYSAVIMDSNNPENLLVASSGSPMVIGLGIGGNFVASDKIALLPVTNHFIILDEGNIAEVTNNSVDIFDKSGNQLQYRGIKYNLQYDTRNKGIYSHYMQKEIHEQPKVIKDTMAGRINHNGIDLSELGVTIKLFTKVEHIQIVACGSSYNSGMLSRYWFESLVDIPCNVDIASEFCYRKPAVYRNSLIITISQSGETADTLAALRLSRKLGYLGSLTICNVPDSSLARESNLVLMTKAGIEIGVASTKAFTTQLTVMLMLVAKIANMKGRQYANIEHKITKGLQVLPDYIERIISNDNCIQQLAKVISNKRHVLFLGRGYYYPIAIEGALKLKEISYIHAEAYAAGEMKHGPLALIDSDMPVIVLAPNNSLLEKLKSNIEEVRARNGQLYIFTDRNAGFIDSYNMHILEMPYVEDIIAPIFYVVPLQLLSYYVALIKGTDIDQPRNLAKSVTVE